MPAIIAVEKGSPAHEAGIRPGDILASIQGKPLRDYIDFLFLTSEPTVEMDIQSIHGEQYTVVLEKGWKQTGITLDGIIYDQLKSCANHCLFCFVDQGLPDARPCLRCKDDDYRFSFLQGSYITLTNLTAEDWQRILSQKLSPLYISVHTTREKQRVRLMGNPKAAPILEQLNRLSEGGLQFHTQIVICPGYNDGNELQNTIEDLSAFGSALLSIGVVPVGLTDYRHGLIDLQQITSETARESLEIIHGWQEEFRQHRGQNVVYGADELYYLAEHPLPSSEDYDEYPQLENGIGMARDFIEETQRTLSLWSGPPLEQQVGIITSSLGAWVWNMVKEEIETKTGLQVHIFPVVPLTLGENITVAGLLTGADIQDRIETIANPPSLLFIPGAMFNEDGKTIDDCSQEAIQNRYSKYNLQVAHSFYDVTGCLNREEKSS